MLAYIPQCIGCLDLRRYLQLIVFKAVEEYSVGLSGRKVRPMKPHNIQQVTKQRADNKTA